MVVFPREGNQNSVLNRLFFEEQSFSNVDGKISRLSHELIMCQTTLGGFISADRQAQLIAHGVPPQLLDMIESTRGRLLGGMPGQKVALRRVDTIPANIRELPSCYQRRDVAALKDELLKSGSYKLYDVAQYMLTGASALNIAYLATSRMALPEEQEGGLLSTKYGYSDLVSQTSGSFIEMQTNHIKIIQAHIDANDYLALGKAEVALRKLQDVRQIAKANEDMCERLRKKAETLHKKVSDCGTKCHINRKSIIKTQNKRNTLKKQLAEVRNRIESLEKEVLNNIKDTDKLQREEKRAKVWNLFTIGLFGLFSKTDYGLDKEKMEHLRKEYYKCKKQQRELEMQLTKEMMEVSTQLGEIIGGMTSGEAVVHEQVAEGALNMALMGIDEVRTGLENYQNFMRSLIQITVTASDNLQRAIEFGGEVANGSGEGEGAADISPEKYELALAMFRERFAFSGNYWLGMGALGEFCSRKFAEVHGEVCRRLITRESDSRNHAKIAFEENSRLIEVLSGRDKANASRANATLQLLENSDAAQRRAEELEPPSEAV